MSVSTKKKYRKNYYLSKKVYPPPKLKSGRLLFFPVIPNVTIMATLSAMWTVFKKQNKTKNPTGLKEPHLFPLGRKCAPVTFPFIIQEDRLGKRGSCN